MFNKTDILFLIAAGVSFVGSIGLWFLYRHDYGLFVGLWVPSILSLWACVRLALLSRHFENH